MTMDKEDIEKAAINYDSRLVAFRAFMKGADWRINSVWHDVLEEPQGNNDILVLNSKGVAFCVNSYGWRGAIKIFGIVKWAYIKDLIPNTED